jgi:hypothetical protein
MLYLSQLTWLNIFAEAVSVTTDRSIVYTDFFTKVKQPFNSTSAMNIRIPIVHGVRFVYLELFLQKIVVRLGSPTTLIQYNLLFN